MTDLGFSNPGIRPLGPSASPDTGAVEEVRKTTNQATTNRFISSVEARQTGGLLAKPSQTPLSSLLSIPPKEMMSGPAENAAIGHIITSLEEESEEGVEGLNKTVLNILRRHIESEEHLSNAQLGDHKI